MIPSIATVDTPLHSATCFNKNAAKHFTSPSSAGRHLDQFRAPVRSVESLLRPGCGIPVMWSSDSVCF